MDTDRLITARARPTITPARCAERLRTQLERHGVEADVHEGYGLALVSVWIELVVWTDGRWFRWSSGRTSIRGRPVYSFTPALDVVTAARRVADRYSELRRKHSHSPRFLGEGS
jgi:hypothetical protein